MDREQAFLKLQNGSDVRGIAMAGVAGQDVNLTEEAAYCITVGFVQWLEQKLGKKGLAIGVGRDSRLTGAQLQQVVLGGIADAGATGTSCGMASTPAMFMSTQFTETDFDGGIMITASHLPANRNGLKFFTKEGGLDKPDITAVLKLAAAAAYAPKSNGTGEASYDLIGRYSKFLCEKIIAGVGNGPQPLKGLHVVVDAGNGAGGFFASRVLEPLGADVSGSQFLEPDGSFPNHIPNPEEPEAMESIRQAVLLHKADLGLIFDTDVDRMSAVLSSGEEVNRDAIIATMSAIVAPNCPKGWIVTDSVTSHKLTDFLENKLGLHHHRFKRGYKNVINECIRLNQSGTPSPLAIETSGHGALQENFYLDDGAYMAVKILVAAAKLTQEGKSLQQLLEGFTHAYEARLYSIANLDKENMSGYGDMVLAEFEKRAAAAGVKIAPNSHEGVRLIFDAPELSGWVLLRKSLHDPVMPLNLEGDGEGQCSKILEIVKPLLAGFDKLDLSILDK